MNLLSKVMSWFKPHKNVTEVATTKTLIWDVVDGPFTREEFNEEDLREFGIDEDDNYCLVVKMEEDGKLGLVNLWFPEIEDANKLKDHFKYHIEPLELIE